MRNERQRRREYYVFVVTLHSAVIALAQTGHAHVVVCVANGWIEGNGKRAAWGGHEYMVVFARADSGDKSRADTDEGDVVRRSSEHDVDSIHVCTSSA